MYKLLVVICGMFVLASCTHKEEHTYTGYPPKIEKIITTNCSVSGCHNTASKGAAAGLDMSTWTNLFNGTNNGAVVIPFRGDFSTLLYFTNVDSSLGLVTLPTMPINKAPLSTTDFLALKQWIMEGAPDANGNIMFSDNPQRHKFYVVNQGCDVVSVFDGTQKVVMRMVDVGQNPGANPPENPHTVKCTPDGKSWATVFLKSDIVQLYDAETDQLTKTIPIGDGISGQWNTLAISKDSKKAYSADYSGGRIAFIDLENGTSQTYGPFPITGSSAPTLHGVALNSGDDTLYVTCQDISKLIKIPINDVLNYQDINLQGSQPVPGVSLKPHEVVFSPDYSKYFVTCQDTNVNQVRVYSTHTDQLLAVIHVGVVPLEMAVSAAHQLLFVTCQEDNYFSDMKGSVRAIDLNTLTQVGNPIKVGWQPHGLAIDESAGVVYVANRNYSGGPAPHHAAACGGNNGYLTAIDMNTLQKINSFKPELSVDPYQVSVRP